MFSIVICGVMSCLTGLISGHVDTFLSSPDVDTRAGFFPDSGYLNWRDTWERPEQDEIVLGARQNLSKTNRTETAGQPPVSLSKRLLQLRTRLSARKSTVAERKKPLSWYHTENPILLFLFTGSKDSKV